MEGMVGAFRVHLNTQILNPIPQNPTTGKKNTFSLQMSKLQPKQNIGRFESLKAIKQEAAQSQAKQVNPKSTWCGEESSFGEVDAKSYVEKQKRFEEKRKRNENWPHTNEELNLASPGESFEELPMVEEPIFASMEERFEDWMHKHNVQYKDDAEKEKRFKIFKRKAKMVDELNKYFESRQLFCTYRTNIFADKTNKEMAPVRNGTKSEEWHQGAKVS